jgi:DNA-binding CsgD family transcriptional regulator
MLLQQAEHQAQFSPWPVLAHTSRVARAQLSQDPRLLAISLPLEIFFLHRYGPVERCERRTREIEAIHADGNYTYNSPWIWMYRARNALARGQVDQAERDLRHSLHNDANYINYRQDSLGQLVAILLGRIAYLRGDMELALSHVGALLSERPITMLEMLVGAHVDVAVCEFALGNVEHAQALLAAVRHQAEDDDLPLLGAMAGLTQIDLAARMGDRALLERLAAQCPPADWWAQASEPFALPWCVVEAAARAQHAVLRQAGDGRGALAVAEAFLALALRSGHQLAVLAAHLMAATAEDDGATDPPRAAQLHLEQALQLATSCGVVQPVLDAGVIALNRLRQWLGPVSASPSVAAASASASAPAEVRTWARRVLATWEVQFRSRAQRAAASTLTPRELDVLGQLAQQHSTKLIARALMLSPETIKHHLKGIYAKLAVGSRDEAVAEARRRALIP